MRRRPVPRWWALATSVVVVTVLTVGPSAPAAVTAAPASERVLAFGAATTFAGPVPDDAVALAATPSGGGIVVAGAGGTVAAHGDAVDAGSVGRALNAPVLDVAATPTGRGYWLLAADGGVFTFGDAGFFGSTGDVRLNEPIVGMAASPSGRGYWLVARDGGVFTFGDAGFFGSTGDVRLNEPIVGMAASPSGRGYLLAARDGGVFTFGDAAFHGSGSGRLPPGTSATGIEVRPQADGYWIVASPRRVRLALAGDVHGERQIADELRRGGNPLAEVAPVLAAADVAAVNLETPAAAGTPQSKEFVFLAPPELLAALRTAGVDVVSLANNHALDHGPGALLETIRRAGDAGLVVVGAGATAAEAFRPRYVQVRGQAVGFVGLSRVVPPGWAATASRAGVASAYDERAALAAVRDAAAHAETVVVLVHWGIELDRCPGADLVRLADALHAAGADVVAGHHPHVLQGVDARTERVTAYSLGNFVWYHDRPPSDLTGILQVTADPGGGLDTGFAPARIGSDGHPRLLTGPEADAARRSTFTGSGGCWRG